MTDKEIYDFLDGVFIDYINADLGTMDAINKIAAKMKEIREGEKKCSH